MDSNQHPFDVLPPHTRDFSRECATGEHQIQDFTEAVPRSGVILIGDFFAGLPEYATNNHFQKAVFYGTLIVPETWPFGI